MPATPVMGHPRLPQLACSLSAALTALQPHWLPPLQCSLPADTIAAQPHWRSSLPCPPTCGAASRLPHHCSTASFPLTPRTSPVAPGVGYWSRSRRGHHRAAHGASPGLVLPNLCIAAENFAALSPPSGSSSTYPPPALAPPTEKNPAASASESVYCSVSSQADLDFPRYTPPLVNSPSLQRPSCKSPSGLPSPKLLPEGGRRFGWSWRAKWRQSEPSINRSGCIAAMRKVGTRPVHIATHIPVTGLGWSVKRNNDELIQLKLHLRCSDGGSVCRALS